MRAITRQCRVSVFKWGDTRFFVPARLAAFCMANHTHFGLSGLCLHASCSPPGEQMRFGLHPAPVFPQHFQQLRSQWHITITIPFAMTDVDDHAVAVDVFHLQAV